MARNLAQRELRNNSAAVIDAVVAGETFVVARNGKQVAELRPLGSTRPTFDTRESIEAWRRPPCGWTGTGFVPTSTGWSTRSSDR